MKKKYVDIIIPVYNTSSLLLGNAIESALGQSYKFIQIIIVNDGSDKLETIKTIQKYSNKQNVTVVEQKNSGVSSARNAGLKSSNGEYAFFLDSDDTIDSDYIERLVKTMHSKRADLVFSGITDPLTGITEAPIVNDWVNLENDIAKIILKNHTFVCSAVLIKSAIIENNKFSTDLAMGEDTIFILSIMKNAACFYEGKGGYYYNKHQNNSSSCKSVKAMNKYLDDSLSMAKIFRHEYDAPKDITDIFCNKKISIIFRNGVKRRDIKNAMLCIKKSDIYKKRTKIKNIKIIKEKNLSTKNKIIQLIVNNYGVDFLYYLSGAWRVKG